MIKRATAVLLLLAALGVAACGDDGDDDGGDGAQTASAAEAEVKTTVLAFVKATAEGNGKAACEQLSENAKNLAARAAGAKAKTCEGVVAEGSKRIKDDYRERLRAVGPGDVHVVVREATATANIDGARATARLVRHDEHWLIDSYGTAP